MKKFVRKLIRKINEPFSTTSYIKSDKTQESRVIEMFEEMLNNFLMVTSVDVRESLTKAYPFEKWSQNFVSNITSRCYSEGLIEGLSYHYNGEFREYTIFVGDSEVAAKELIDLGSSSRTMPRKVSRLAIVERMKDSKGRFYTVALKNINGAVRIANGQTKKEDFSDDRGFINFRESNGNLMKIDPMDIEEVTLGKEKYIVR